MDGTPSTGKWDIVRIGAGIYGFGVEGHSFGMEKWESGGRDMGEYIKGLSTPTNFSRG